MIKPHEVFETKTPVILQMWLSRFCVRVSPCRIMGRNCLKSLVGTRDRFRPCRRGSSDVKCQFAEYSGMHTHISHRSTCQCGDVSGLRLMWGASASCFKSALLRHKHDSESKRLLSSSGLRSLAAVHSRVWAPACMKAAKHLRLLQY